MENLIIKVGGGWFEKWFHSQAIITPNKGGAQVFTHLYEAEAVENDLIQQGWQPLIQNKNDEVNMTTHESNILTRFCTDFFKLGHSYTTQEIIDWLKKEIPIINNVYTDEMKKELSIIIVDCIIDSKEIYKITSVLDELKQ